MAISKRLHLHAAPVVIIIATLLVFTALAVQNSVDANILGSGLTTKVTNQKNEAPILPGASLEKPGQLSAWE